MKKIFIIGIALIYTSLMIVGLPHAQTEDTAAKVFDKLKTDLENKGVAAADITNIERPLKEMINKGATKDDLKKVLVDLANYGLKGKDLRDSVNSMNELVKSGETPKEAGNIVSKAAHQAHAQGLKGKELAAKVHEAIKQRKAQRQQEKQQTKQQKLEMKGKEEKSKGKPQEKVSPEKCSVDVGGKGKGKK